MDKASGMGYAIGAHHGAMRKPKDASKYPGVIAMDNGYLSLFGALPDLIAIASRRALLRLSAAFIVIALIVAVAYFTLDFYQLWQVWPILWRPSLAISSTSVSYVTLQSNGMLLLLALEFLTLNGPAIIVGAFGRSRPALMFAQALLAAIAARDPAIAPTVETDQTTITTTDEPAARIIERLAHPAGVLSATGVYVGGVVCGLLVVGCGAWLFASSYSFMLSAPDPAVAALNIPFLTWLSAYRFVMGIGAIAFPLMLGGCFAIAWMLIALRYTRIARRGMTAHVDAGGIHAQFSGARGIEWTARWADVRGFARLGCRDSWLHDHEVYLLLAGERVLLWEKQPIIRYTKPEMTAYIAATRDAADALVAAVTRYALVPLVDVSEFLTASNRGLTGAHAYINWDLLGSAELIARSNNDLPLWRAIWEKRHPGKSAPEAPRKWTASFFLFGMFQSTRTNILHAAKALLPHYPPPETMRAALRTRFLSRTYTRFALTIFCLALIWAAASLVFIALLFNHTVHTV